MNANLYTKKKYTTCLLKWISHIIIYSTVKLPASYFKYLSNVLLNFQPWSSEWFCIFQSVSIEEAPALYSRWTIWETVSAFCEVRAGSYLWATLPLIISCPVSSTLCSVSFSVLRIVCSSLSCGCTLIIPELWESETGTPFVITQLGELSNSVGSCIKIKDGGGLDMSSMRRSCV